jgi:hypothetical protein
MRLRLIRRSARQRELVDAAVTAYAQWRSEALRCGLPIAGGWLPALGTTCLRSTRTKYALDREKHAAKRYARIISRAAALPETALLHQLAGVEIGVGGDRAMATTGLDHRSIELRGAGASPSRPAFVLARHGAGRHLRGAG